MGSNTGRPAARILTAVRGLSRALGPVRVASLYLTEPVSDVPQPDFLNTAVAAVTDRPLRDLLALAKTLEARSGRLPGPRWGPRPLDVDILLAGDERLDEPDLVVPHRELWRRRFALAPLADLIPDAVVPGQEATVAELLRRAPDRGRVDRIGWPGALLRPMP